MEKFAIIYDFDYTLSTKNSFEFSLFPSYGINNDSEFMNNIEDDTIATEVTKLLIQKVRNEN